MEPRRDDGDDMNAQPPRIAARNARPQWSPVVTTGTTREDGWFITGWFKWPQWSPVVTTGTTARRIRAA